MGPRLKARSLANRDRLGQFRLVLLLQSLRRMPSTDRQGIGEPTVNPKRGTQNAVMGLRRQVPRGEGESLAALLRICTRPFSPRQSGIDQSLLTSAATLLRSPDEVDDRAVGFVRGVNAAEFEADTFRVECGGDPAGGGARVKELGYRRHVGNVH